MLTALLVMVSLALLLGIVLGYSALKFKVEGDPLVARIDANLLGVEYKPLNAEHGLPKPKAQAVIDENICIGCTLCLQACPVDAILGAAKHMHTVIAPECTGCELCLAPCPVDCISMEPIAETPDNWKWRYPVFAIQPADKMQQAA